MEKDKKYTVQHPKNGFFLKETKDSLGFTANKANATKFSLNKAQKMVKIWNGCSPKHQDIDYIIK